MSASTQKPLTGAKVAAMMCTGFAVIIAVNLTLAFKAVATFPGLETKNSYVASQAFEADRTAQEALGWDVAAMLDGQTFRLVIEKDGQAVQPVIRSAVLGRATHVSEDRAPDLIFDGRRFVAPVDLPDGNWNLRLVAEAEDGTLFRQRIVVRSAK